MFACQLRFHAEPPTSCNDHRRKVLASLDTSQVYTQFFGMLNHGKSLCTYLFPVTFAITQAESHCIVVLVHLPYQGFTVWAERVGSLSRDADGIECWDSGSPLRVQLEAEMVATLTVSTAVPYLSSELLQLPG